MTLVVVDGLNKPMVWRNNSSRWVETRANGDVRTVVVDNVTVQDLPTATISVLTSAGYIVTPQ